MTTSSATVFQPEVESVTEFLERFKVQNAIALSAATGDGADAAKATILCRALPVAVITDVQRRIKPTSLSTATYEQIEKSLKSQYSVTKSPIGASVKFINRKQQQGETIETYAKVLNDLASECDYKDCCRDRMLRDIFVSGLSSNKLISNLLQDCEGKSFNDCIERAKTLVQLSNDAEDMKPEEKMQSSNRVDCNYNNKSSANKSSKNKNKNNSSSYSSSKKVSNDYVCIRCGTRGKHLANDCFAIDMTCNKCSKKGHLAKVCKSSGSRIQIINDEYDEHDNCTCNPRMHHITSSSSSSAAAPVPATQQAASSSSSGPRHCCCDVTDLNGDHFLG